MTFVTINNGPQVLGAALQATDRPDPVSPGQHTSHACIEPQFADRAFACRPWKTPPVMETFGHKA